jgi:hypothetical protein
MRKVKVTVAAATLLREWAEELGGRLQRKDPGPDGMVELELDPEVHHLLLSVDMDPSVAIEKLVRRQA